uniref:Uncharacterized protein n=1 Tax=Helicotheca tamesis TaxID=374047 RepID=A0A7S2MUW1_9STRA|mmetsp:Transcript_3967/g.5354  ORF Transcript_3967/g.5354 Transcript_3967/m.5354 type:complete len:151 (+) Transcript_3967:103-555(+)|eukprot:CAMPEP_0185730470 /NCGR_PEP_ID=MMETSP1171-20130828/9938_1 /TAXON_ID=374046 /ORGANISM="Helicotheca tamensis, Strain CCMP826" /LENGTH=150 /DNA_ID=CAMNT_0028399515 /DNA_START=98 /DNA_END=550 /DNA_ORIENTATION=+
MKNFTAIIIAFTATLLGSVSAFVSPSGPHAPSFGVQSTTVTPKSFGQTHGTAYFTQQLPTTIQKQRRSVAPVQTMSLFGLGGPEIAIILIAAAFLLGPQKLAELGKDAGKIAGELKEVPKEFQKGMAEGEEQAKEIKEDILGEAKDAEKE